MWVCVVGACKWTAGRVRGGKQKTKTGAPSNVHVAVARDVLCVCMCVCFDLVCCVAIWGANFISPKLPVEHFWCAWHFLKVSFVNDCTHTHTHAHAHTNTQTLVKTWPATGQEMGGGGEGEWDESWGTEEPFSVTVVPSDPQAGPGPSQSPGDLFQDMQPVIKRTTKVSSWPRPVIVCVVVLHL